ncbi:hypothetical protein X777_16916, partial [Ooceraea biroi]
SSRGEPALCIAYSARLARNASRAFCGIAGQLFEANVRERGCGAAGPRGERSTTVVFSTESGR